MKNFAKIDFDLIKCRNQLVEFQELLQSKRGLSERDDILPFFRERQELSALVGGLHPKLYRYERIAFEYDIFGDFVADLVVGDAVTKAYCFVEFESAVANSVFVSKSGKSTPEWSPTF